MNTELTMLAWSAALAFVQMNSTAALLTLDRGIKVNLDNRESLPLPGGLTGRSTRALTNLVESLVIFAAAVIVVQLAGRNNGLTALGAEIFFFSRVLYWIVYLIGIPYVRTIVWTVAVTGILLVLIPLFVS